MKKAMTETKTRYLISYEHWQWDEEDESYTSGPYDVEEFEVSTLEEANCYINDFNESNPKSKKIRISYDKKDPMFGIVSRKLIMAKVSNYEKDGEKWQMEFSVFEEVVEL